MLVLYVDCSSSAVECICTCGKYICSGGYTNDVKCLYTSVPGHIVDCSGFVWDIYTNIVVSYVHLN